MLIALKTSIAIACLVMLIPLSVWAATGSLRHAWFALKEYLIVMSILVIPGVIFGAIAILTS